MFGICHWLVISPSHPWAKIIQHIQKRLDVYNHTPHITICTHSNLTFDPPVATVPLGCTANVSQSSGKIGQDTLHCLEIPVAPYTRPDEKTAHLTLVYRWNKQFTVKEIEIAAEMCLPMPQASCQLLEHQVWECNGAPETWKRVVLERVGT